MRAVSDPETQRWVDIVARTAFWEDLAQYCYALFFAAFALGAALLLLSCFLPARTERAGERGWRRRLAGARRAFRHAGGVLLLLLLCISQQMRVDARRGFLAEQDNRYAKAMREMAAKRGSEEARRAEYLYMPTGDSLAYMSLGNTGLAADYLWLTSLQYVSNSFRRGEKFDLLLRFYHTMLDLDPHWVEIHVQAGRVLSALEQDRYAVEDFYIAAIVKNPDRWRLPYEAGRLFVVPPLNPALRADYGGRATAWFGNAITKLKKLPPNPAVDALIRRTEDTIARLAVESGYYEAAEAMLWQVAQNENNPIAMRRAAARDWLNAHSLLVVSRLQEGVDAYRKEHGAWPQDLRPALPRLEGIRRIHVDPQRGLLDAFGLPIRYDQAAGRVASRGAQARRAIQQGTVLNGMLDLYRGHHPQQLPPNNLADLQRFLLKYFSASYNPAPPAITEALGAEMNTTISAFEEPWDYDANAGRVKLPDVCNPATLFRNAGELVPDE